MFLLRSAFWLTVAFIVVAPKDTDLGNIASSFSSDALAAGQNLVVSQVLQSDCQSIECAGSKIVLTSLSGTTIPSIDTPMQDLSSLPVPLPRPRPDRMG